MLLPVHMGRMMTFFVLSTNVSPMVFFRSDARQMYVICMRMLVPTDLGWGSRRSPDLPMPWAQGRDWRSVEKTRPSRSPTPRFEGALLVSSKESSANRYCIWRGVKGAAGMARCERRDWRREE